MQFKCPKCSGVVSMSDANLGKTVSCGHCKEIVKAPANRFDSGVIINDFIIEREVGVGGMGVVYLARQMSLDRPVALKILKEKYASDTEFIVQFIREARSAAKLNHPNIVQAYAVGEEDGIFFFAMEFVDGETMKDILLREKKIEPVRAASITKDIANALDYAWTESKIVHHDIKPDNIMLTQSGKSKLADLGLASIFGESEIDEDGDEVLGTPQYISPEQLLGDPTDIRSDIYSLGATLYHFVTGAFSYNGNSPAEIAHQHVNGVLKPPVEVFPELPLKLNDIILKMMARNVSERYQGAGELVRDLQSFIDNPVATASVPVSTVSSASGRISTPDGGVRLSFGSGSKFPPAPKVKTADPAFVKTDSVKNSAAASVPEKAVSASGNDNKNNISKSTVSKPILKPAAGKTGSVAVPKVNLSSPSRAVPKITQSASVPKISGTSAMPKLNVSTAGEKKDVPVSAAPELKKPSAPVLKKAEPVSAPSLAVKNENKEVPAEKKEEKKENKKEIPAASAAPNKPEKTKSGVKKAKIAGKGKNVKNKDQKMPGWLKVIIFSVVFILLAGGGIAYYMYRNNWTLPPWEKFKVWNAKRKEFAKRVVRRVPLPPKKELSVEELRKDYVPEINKLKKFIADNPSSGKTFLTNVDNFIKSKGKPQLENEKAPFASLIDLYNEIDEKVWAAPGRSALQRAHQTEINRRIKTEKDRLSEEAKIAAAKKLEADNRIAFQKAEAEHRRQESESVRIIRQKQNEYRAKIAPVYKELSVLFYDAVKDESKTAEFNEKIASLFVVFKPDGVQMEIHQKLEEYGKRLQAELPQAQKVYRFMTESSKPFVNHIVVLPRVRQVEIIDFSFKDSNAKVLSVISQRVSNVSLKEEAVRQKIFALFRRKMPKVKELEYIEFFYQLFFGDKNAAKSAKIPAPVWREFFNYYR